MTLLRNSTFDVTWTSRHRPSLAKKVLELVSKLVVHSSIIILVGGLCGSDLSGLSTGLLWIAIEWHCNYKWLIDLNKCFCLSVCLLFIFHIIVWIWHFHRSITTVIKTFITPSHLQKTVGLHGSAYDTHELRADPQFSLEHLIIVDI